MTIYLIGTLIAVVVGYLFDIIMKRYQDMQRNPFDKLDRTFPIELPEVGDVVHVYNPHIHRVGFAELIQVQVVAITHQETRFVLQEISTEEAYTYSLHIKHLVSANGMMVFVAPEPKPRIGDKVMVCSVRRDMLHEGKYDPHEPMVEGSAHVVFNVLHGAHPDKVVIGMDSEKYLISLEHIAFDERKGYSLK